jgi:hypothetical protein
MRTITRTLAALVAAVFLTVSVAPLASAGEDTDPWTFEECAQEFGDYRSQTIAELDALRHDVEVLTRTSTILSARLADATQTAEARYHRIVELEQVVRDQEVTIADQAATIDRKQATIDRLRERLNGKG